MTALNLLRICSVWLLVLRNSPLQLSKGISVTMMLSIAPAVFAVNADVLLSTAGLQ